MGAFVVNDVALAEVKMATEEINPRAGICSGDPCIAVTLVQEDVRVTSKVNLQRLNYLILVVCEFHHARHQRSRCEFLPLVVRNTDGKRHWGSGNPEEFHLLMI